MLKLDKTKLIVSNLIVWILDEADKMLDSYSIQQYYQSDLRAMYRVKMLERTETAKAKKRFYSALQYLKKKEFIKEELKNNRKYYTLTKLGKRRSLLGQAMNYKKKPHYKKYLHLVIFDVPEKYKHLRSLLRRNLYYLDYKNIQRSCFVSDDKKACELLNKIIRETHLQPYVKIFIIKKQLK